MDAELSSQRPHAGERLSRLHFSDGNLIFDLSRDLLPQRDGAFLADAYIHGSFKHCDTSGSVTMDQDAVRNWRYDLLTESLKCACLVSSSYSCHWEASH